ncbi:hypothetical protein OROMI_028535 [Orobanche minor]
MAFSSSLAASSQNDVVTETCSTPRALSKRVNITKGGSEGVEIFLFFGQVLQEPAVILFCFSKQLGNSDNKPPSGAEIFLVTRKWDEKRTYKSAYDSRTFLL